MNEATCSAAGTFLTDAPQLREETSPLHQDQCVNVLGFVTGVLGLYTFPSFLSHTQMGVHTNVPLSQARDSHGFGKLFVLLFCRSFIFGFC